MSLAYHSLTHHHSGVTTLKLKVEVKAAASHYLFSANTSTGEARGQLGLVCISFPPRAPADPTALGAIMPAHVKSAC